MDGNFQVYFKSAECDVDSAVLSLRESGLNVVEHNTYVTVSSPGSPEFDIGINAEAYVREEATAVSEGTPYRAAMQGCDARFEVSFEDLEAALDEFNTMAEIQVALQEASGGFLFLPWNGRLGGSES